MRHEPKVTRFGADPTVDQELATKAYVDAGGGGGGNDVGCRVTKSGAQSIPNNSPTVATWDTETYDTDSMHDNSVNNDRITFNTAGKYLVGVRSNWGFNSTARRFVSISLNGGATRIAEVDSAATSESDQSINVIFDFIVGDFINVEVYQNSGGALNFTGGLVIGCSFYAQKIDRGG